MFNKRTFADLRSALNSYKQAIDSILKETKIDDSLRNVYSADYFGQLQEKQSAIAKQSMDNARERARNSVNSMIKSLRKDIEDWANAPIDDGLFKRLQAAKITNTKLSRTELELFAKEAAGRYMEMKILSNIAAESGFVLTAPSVETYCQDVANIQSGCDTLLKTYAGAGLEGIKLLPHNFINGVDYGAFEGWQCVTSDYILKDGGTLDETEARWGSNMAHIEEKTALTDAEAEKVSRFYEGHSDTKARTIELLQINPELRGMIKLSQFAEYLPEE